MMPLLNMQRYAVGMEQRMPASIPRGPGFEYRYLTEFQSHEPEFDYLKSLEIEEKINKVRWVRSSNNTKHIIATNDKTIKLWKVSCQAMMLCMYCYPITRLAACTCCKQHAVIH